jgi:putative membrane protein
MAMGIADLIPGVSGGTVALIGGIYDELVSSLAGLNFQLISVWRKDGLKAAIVRSNLAFLVAVVAGAVTSVFAFAGLLHGLMASSPELLWAFFLGLVAASVPLVGREAGAWRGKNYVLLWRAELWVLAGVGLALAGVITSLPPLVQSDGPLYLFISGCIAICAMILPGISGSFILLILGSYGIVIGALKEMDVVRIASFFAGAVVGLMAFSRVLKRMLERHRARTMALMTGFLLGSLNALWPWKIGVRELYTHSDGRVEYWRVNRLPEAAEWGEGLLWILAGALLVTAFHQVRKRRG